MPGIQLQLGTPSPTALVISFPPNVTVHIEYTPDARGRFLPTVRDTRANFGLSLTSALRSTVSLKGHLLHNAIRHGYTITQLSALETALRALVAPSQALASLDIWVVSAWAARSRGEGGWSDGGLRAFDSLDARGREVMLRTAVRDAYAVLVAHLLATALRHAADIELEGRGGLQVLGALEELGRIGWALVRSVRDEAASWATAR